MAKKKIDFDDLPSDILYLILMRVALVKSLLRFKSVSKSWNVIISDNEFKRTHRDQSKALGREHLLLHKSSTNEFEFRDMETSQLVRMANGIFPPEKFRKALVLCSCDGLVLLKNPRAYKTYVLWNPSTGEYQTLVCPCKGKVPNACGICYDSGVGDYKVVLIYESSYGIYSLKNDCWTEKEKSSRSHIVRALQNCSLFEGISFTGGVYWYNCLGDGNSILIYFDVKSDELKPLRDFVKENEFVGLTNLKGCLSLYGGNAQSHVLHVWIMERDEWKLLMNVCNLPSICKTFVKDYVLLCSARNGEIVFQERKTFRLFIIDPRQQLPFQMSNEKSKITTCLDSLYFPSLKSQEEEGAPAFVDGKSIFSFNILFSILIRLPVKSLLRFQMVSKPWNAVISDNEFKKTHRGQSKALGREKLLLDQVWKGVFEFRDLESSQLVLMENKRFPLKTFQQANSLCSCDGLVLLRNHFGKKKHVLWNPSTGEYRVLTSPDNLLYYNDEHAYGLCYDSSVGDYKVVLIYDLFYVVYSLMNDSWTRKTSWTTKTSFSCPTPEESKGITTEGRVFWSMLFVDRTSTIIYFDVKLDEMKELPSPDFIGEKDFFHLTSLKGRLGLYGGRTMSKQLNIWIMEHDGSWTWLMKICKLPAICKTFLKDHKFLCCTRNGEVLFKGRYALLLYNPRTQLLREAQKFRESIVASTYLDTLYFPRLSLKCKRKQSTIPLTTGRPKVQKQ